MTSKKQINFDAWRARAAEMAADSAYPLPGGAYQGLTKRELFAAMAMMGALGGAPGQHLHPEALAAACIGCADALIDELVREEP